MNSNDLWNADRARRYDTPGTGLFEAGQLDRTTARLERPAESDAALEFAIGTGRVAVPLRARGVPVSGIDLSSDMVAVLRTKAGEDAIPVVIGDMAGAGAPGSFALVYPVWNTIGNLLTQEAQAACFRNAARRLRPGGRFPVENMVPDLRRLPPGE